MRKLSFVFVLGLVVSILVVACGSNDATPTTKHTIAPRQVPNPSPAATTEPTATRIAATATPAPTRTPVPPTATPLPLVKRGGILRTRIEYTPGTPAHWNLLQGPTNADFPLFEPVYSSLVQLNMTDMSVAPDLAESWSYSPDGKVITFKIRKGVTWHDGSALTAGDIKYNWDVMTKDAGGFISIFKALLTAADDTKAVDDSTFQITLKRPSNSFFRTLTHGLMVDYSPRVSIADVNAGKVVGTNAYKWTNFDKDKKVEERAYAGYWDKGVDGKPLPYLDGIDFFVIPDTTAHLAAFRTGQIDAFDHINATTLVGQIDNIKKDIPNLATGNSYDSWRMLILKNRAPLNNPVVRKALQIGFDRGSFVQAGLGGVGLASGYADPPKDYQGSWAPTMSDQEKIPGMSSANKKQDIAEAERLLGTAGYTATSPLTLTVYVVSGTANATEAEAAITLLNVIKGIKLNLVVEPSAVHNQRLVVPKGDFDMIYRPFAQAIDDPSQTMGLFWVTNASRNYGEWSDTQLDDMYGEQETTTDTARRTQLVASLQTRIYDDAFNIVLAWTATPWVRRPEMRNMPLGGSFVNRGRYDKTWIDK